MALSAARAAALVVLSAAIATRTTAASLPHVGCARGTLRLARVPRRRVASRAAPRASLGAAAAAVGGAAAALAAPVPELAGARDLCTRALGFVATVACVGARRQNRALIGARGLAPIQPLLERELADAYDFSPWRACRGRLTLAWWPLARALRDQRAGGHGDAAEDDTVGRTLDVLAVIGAAAGTALAAVGASLGWGSALLCALLWCAYASIVNAAVLSPFYRYGWESQLLETCALCAFASLGAPGAPPAAVSAWAFRWLCVRIMLGAGLIKWRSGERKWRDLSAMDTFYETQPLPTPLASVMHRWLPRAWHRAETAFTHAVESAAPLLLLLPGRRWGFEAARAWNGWLQIGFQGVLILCGNLAFLNWLTICPHFWSIAHLPVLGGAAVATRAAGAGGARHAALAGLSRLRDTPVRAAVDGALGAALAYLSLPSARNLLSSRQKMNACFNRYRLSNAYGAFGSLSDERLEIVISATRAYQGEATEWREYVFAAKPGPVRRAPPVYTPYHCRLDWQMWFVPLRPRADAHPWLLRLMLRLLQGDARVRARLARRGGDPFVGADGAAADAGGADAPPTRIVADLYRYTFGAQPLRTGVWWEREHVRALTPLLDAPALEARLRALGEAP